jgi:hypothetical protein
MGLRVKPAMTENGKGSYCTRIDKSHIVLSIITCIHNRSLKFPSLFSKAVSHFTSSPTVEL